MAISTDTPRFIYKIASSEAWEAFRSTGRFPGMPVDLKDGYIHFSTAAQLAETLRLHFAGQEGLVVFAVRSSELEPALRWEPSRGGQMFPHLYGDLSIAGVGDHAIVAVAADGSADLPAWVR